MERDGAFKLEDLLGGETVEQTIAQYRLDKNPIPILIEMGFFYLVQYVDFTVALGGPMRQRALQWVHEKVNSLHNPTHFDCKT